MSDIKEIVGEAVKEYIKNVSTSLPREGEYNLALLDNGRGYTLFVVRAEDSKEIRVSGHFGRTDTDSFERNFPSDEKGVADAVDYVRATLARWIDD